MIGTLPAAGDSGCYAAHVYGMTSTTTTPVEPEGDSGCYAAHVYGMTSTTTTPVEPEGGSDIELAAEVRTAKAGDALREKLTAGVVITGLALLAAVVAVNTVIFVNTRAYNEAAVQRTLAEEFDLTVTDDQASKIVLGEEAVVVTTYGTKVELRSSDATASGLAKNPHPTFTIAVPLEKP